GQVPAARPSRQEVSRDSGWLASSSSVARELGHPLLEQMANIECFLAQARSAGRLSEARTLEENLQQLQDEWDRMQKEEAQESERSRRKPEAYSFEAGTRKPEAYTFEEGSMEEERSRRKPEAYQASPFNDASQAGGGLNPFEEDTEGPNPFEEEERNWRSPSTCPFEGKSEVCNPFEEVEASGNPFEEQKRSWGFGGNPFEMEEEEEEIEEELLRQQIDNIKAYVFDAKQAGRLDEMASLLDNLAELKQALEGARSRHQAH
ncbi:rabenosyn-5, partial [Rhincodon typus]|uniref:rabenosyn-5 n=1 Tax=Rhincodon typus TaxID=259920 RepID=UPI00202E683E